MGNPDACPHCAAPVLEKASRFAERLAITSRQLSGLMDRRPDVAAICKVHITKRCVRYRLDRVDDAVRALAEREQRQSEANSANAKQPRRRRRIAFMPELGVWARPKALTDDRIEQIAEQLHLPADEIKRRAAAQVLRDAQAALDIYEHGTRPNSKC